MSYAPFELLPEQVRERRIAERRKGEMISRDRENIVRSRGLQELKSDYLNMSTYYFDPSTRSIVSIESTIYPVKIQIPPSREIEHIKALNGMWLTDL